MKHYIIECQTEPEGKVQPVSMHGKVRQFVSPQVAVSMARFVKRQLEEGAKVKVVSKGHEGPQEVIEV